MSKQPHSRYFCFELFLSTRKPRKGSTPGEAKSFLSGVDPCGEGKQNENGRVASP